MENPQTVVTQALLRAFDVHELLGESGEILVQKNQFGETALRVDIECEKAILDFLREARISIRVVSEEHGQVDITESPRYLGVLDGLDGSNVYKKERGRARYGTMFGIFDSLDPVYLDYLACGIMEHSTNRLFIASKGADAFVVNDGKAVRIRASRKTTLDRNTRIYVDYGNEFNKKYFSRVGDKFKTHYCGSSAVYYADMAAGEADLTLECTRKNNLEIAVAYGLDVEAGAVMVDAEGNDIGDKKYFEFGQKENVPVITASTRKLAENLIEFLKQKPR